MLRNLLLGTCASGLLTATASAAVQNLTFESGIVSTSTGPLVVIKISATFTDPGDRVIGVSASEFVASGTFYQHPFGSDTEPNGAFFPLPGFETLPYDTFVTIGLASTSQGPATTLAPGAGFSANSFTGGWSASSDGDYVAAGADGKVLLGQFTFTGASPINKVSGSLVLNWHAAGGQLQSTYLERECMGVLTALLCPTLTSEIDANDDCVINGLDLAEFLGHWAAPCPPVFVECVGDFNNDLVVNGLDLAVLLSRWGPVPVCPPK